MICPIGQTLMDDPVIDREGNSYDRAAITQWLREHSNSPLTRNHLEISHLTPNRALRDSIEEWKAAHRAETDPSSAPAHPLPPADAPEPQVSITDEIAVSIETIRDPESTSVANVLVTLNPPVPGRRVPVDVVCVVDVSGSMATSCTVKDSDGAESETGHTSLSLVQHSVKAILNLLTPSDRLAVVKYSDAITTVFGLTPVVPTAIRRLTTQIESISAGGSTDIWGGLERGLRLFTDSEGDATSTRVRHVFLLTDGQPNVRPPRGEVAMLQDFMDRSGPQIFVHTFGFGYNLDSELLCAIAKTGRGTYGFIPDGGFVGTLFVNAVANLAVSFASDTVLSLETGPGVHVVPAPDSGVDVRAAGLEFRDASWGVQVALNHMQYGQSRHVVIPVSTSEVSDTASASSLGNVTVTFKTRDGREVSTTVAVPLPRSHEEASVEFKVQQFRALATGTLELAVSCARRGQYADAKAAITALVDKYRPLLPRAPAAEPPRPGAALSTATASAPGQLSPEDALKAHPSSRMRGLHADLGKESLSAVEESAWKKWGQHYLPSLTQAHAMERCNNFKDPGVQGYGGAIFRTVRSEGDRVFLSLPMVQAYTPRPPGYGSGGSRQATVVASASAFYDSNGVCVHGASLVHTPSGTIRADAVRRGDIVVGPAGRAKIAAVVRTLRPSGFAELCELPGGLLVTPWHPVCINGRWVFPSDMASKKHVECAAIFSFVLERGDDADVLSARTAGSAGTSIYVNGVATSVLAHGDVTDAVLAHAFFGTDAVLEALSRFVGAELGYITVNPEALVRDEDTGHVVDLDVSAEVQQWPGDVRAPSAAARMLRETSCTAVVAAR